MLSNAMLKEYPVTQSNVNKVTGLDGFSKVTVASIPLTLEPLFTKYIIRSSAPSGFRTNK